MPLVSLYPLKTSENLRCFRSSPPEVFLCKGVLKLCSKFTAEHPCRSVISIKLQSNFIEITLRHGCFPVNLLHISRTPFPRNTSGELLLMFFNVSSGFRKKPLAWNELTYIHQYKGDFKLNSITLKNKLCQRFWEN